MTPLCTRCNERPVPSQGKRAGKPVFCIECWAEIEAEMMTPKAESREWALRFLATGRERDERDFRENTKPTTWAR